MLEKSGRRSVIAAIALQLVAMGAIPHTQAAVVTTDQFAGAERRATGEARIANFLAREDVQARLVALGVDPSDAAARVAALTPDEIAMLESQIAELPAGGDVVGVIGVVFLVLLILELVGVTNVFTAI